MKKFISVIIGSIAAAASINLPQAVAQNSLVASPTSTIPNFDPQNIGPVLNEMGITWVQQQADNGKTYIVANVQNVLTFLMAPTVCRNGGVSDCIGLQMVAIFEGDANPQTVQAFNYRYNFATAGLNESGDAFLSRYEIADYGMPRGNLSTSIEVFANQILMFASELDTASRTVSMEGYADDLSASHLNRQVRESILGVEAAPIDPIEMHQRALEEGAVFVRHFLSDKSSPRNKIKNISSE